MDENYLGLPGNMTGNNIGGFTVLPDGFGGGVEDARLNEDRYEVFVNGDKVGDKVQRTQVEDPEYLQSYLTENGFEGFDYEVVGGHIEIHTDQDTHHMKEILSSYLSIR